MFRQRIGDGLGNWTWVYYKWAEKGLVRLTMLASKIEVEEGKFEWI
jgi:hypothetical protein